MRRALVLMVTFGTSCLDFDRAYEACRDGGACLSPIDGTLQFAPAVDFGVVAITVDSDGPSVLVTNGTPSSFLEFAVTSSNAEFSLRPGEGACTNPLGAGSACQLHLRVNAAGPGERSGTLTLSNAGEVLGTIRLSALGRPAITISPEVADAGVVTFDGGAVSLPFLVTHQAGANSGELNVTATLNDGGVLPVAGSCQGATLTMNRTCVVSAVIDPSVLGRGGFAVEVQVDGLPLNGARARASGLALHASRFVALQPSLDFGIVDVGSTAVRELSFENQGDLAAPAAPTISGAEFGLDAGSCGSDVPSGLQCRSAVTFAPVQFGAATATLFEGVNTVPLTGVGRDAVRLQLELVTPSSGDRVECTWPGGGTATADEVTPIDVMINRTDVTGQLSCIVTPGPSSEFLGWTGCTSTNTECTVPTSSLPFAGVVRALFRPFATLWVIADGGVTVSAGGDSLPCSPDCLRVPVGMESAIEVKPALGYRVASISGACSSRTACTVNLDRDGGTLLLGIDGPYNVAFTTRDRFTGAMGGSSQMNFKCTLDARDAGYPSGTTFTAVVGGAFGSISSRGWLRADGLEFGDQLSPTLTAPVPPLHAVSLHANGELPAYDAQGLTAWTGILPDGGTPIFCSAWGNTSGTPSPTVGNSPWLSGPAQSCTTQHPLICVSNGVVRPMGARVIDPSAKRVFVSAQTFPGNFGGRAAGDVICANDAADAGLSGNFGVLLTDGPTFAEQFGDYGLRAVVNARGDVVARRATEFALTGPQAQVVTARGAPSVATFWAGSDAGTCADWTSTAGTAAQGAARAGETSWVRAPIACTSALPLLCGER